jgi:hypothetical protein
MIVSALLLIAAGWFEGAAPAKPDHRVALDVKGGGEILLTPIRFEMESTLQFMFDSVGVHLTWHTGKANTSTLPDLVVIRVRFVRPAIGGIAETGPRCAAAALGCAWPFTRDTVTVVVEYERVQSAVLCMTPRVFPRLLAHILAHEITHILTLTDEHSETGVMKRHWTREDYARMAGHPLAFTAKDIEGIRQGIAFRHRER